jgi:predicted nucleotidyltransferase component of viral defense system
MLQTQTVEPGTLSLLRKLMGFSELSSFLLVGGTALTLHYGHRLSIDLDLFTTEDFNQDSLISFLEENFTEFSYLNRNNPIGLFGYIDDVKVDFIKHPHPIIENPFSHDGIRLMSIPDIVAMKINAIMKRGLKKYFWDIAELLQYYTITDFIHFYTKKYPSQQLLIAIPQALVYFEDAEEGEDPVSLKDQTWESVKKTISQKVSDFLK